MGKDFDVTEMVTGFRDVNSLMAADAMHEDEDGGGWHIENDGAADWAIGKLKSIRKEKERMHEIHKERVSMLDFALAEEDKKFERSEEFFTRKLQEYFGRITPKETDTQYNYKLLSGTLRQTKPKLDYKRDEEKILKALEDQGIHDFTKKSLNWSGLKKTLTIDGNDIINDDGEIVKLDGLTLETVPAKFSIS